MTKDELKAILLARAKAKIARDNRVFNQQALDEIIRFINTGVDTISGSEVNGNYVDIANNGVNKLLERVIFYLEIRDRHSIYVTAIDVQNARSSICPLWPFC